MGKPGNTVAFETKREHKERVLLRHKHWNHLVDAGKPQIRTLGMVRSAQQRAHLAVALGGMETELAHILLRVVEYYAFVMDLFLIALLRLVERFKYFLVGRFAFFKTVLDFVADDSHTVVHALSHP